MSHALFFWQGYYLFFNHLGLFFFCLIALLLSYLLVFVQQGCMLRCFLKTLLSPLPFLLSCICSSMHFCNVFACSHTYQPYCIRFACLLAPLLANILAICLLLYYFQCCKHSCNLVHCFLRCLVATILAIGLPIFLTSCFPAFSHFACLITCFVINIYSVT